MDSPKTLKICVSDVVYFGTKKVSPYYYFQIPADKENSVNVVSQWIPSLARAPAFFITNGKFMAAL